MTLSVNSVARIKHKVSSDYLSSLLYDAQGVRVSDQQNRATLDDYFHIGSCSKSVLALIAAKLIAQKKIDWKTSFFDVFPEFEADANDAYRFSIARTRQKKTGINEMLAEN